MACAISIPIGKILLVIEKNSVIIRKNSVIILDRNVLLLQRCKDKRLHHIGESPRYLNNTNKTKTMKKIKHFALSLVAVAACAGAFGTYENYQQSGESNALLAENVEAMSNTEWGVLVKYAAKYVAKPAKSIFTSENMKKAAMEVGKQLAVGEIIDGIGSFFATDRQWTLQGSISVHGETKGCYMCAYQKGGKDDCELNSIMYR